MLELAVFTQYVNVASARPSAEYVVWNPGGHAGVERIRVKMVIRYPKADYPIATTPKLATVPMLRIFPSKADLLLS